MPSTAATGSGSRATVAPNPIVGIGIGEAKFTPPWMARSRSVRPLIPSAFSQSPVKYSARSIEGAVTSTLASAVTCSGAPRGATPSLEASCRSASPPKPNRPVVSMLRKNVVSRSEVVSLWLRTHCPPTFGRLVGAGREQRETLTGRERDGRLQPQRRASELGREPDRFRDRQHLRLRRGRVQHLVERRTRAGVEVDVGEGGDARDQVDRRRARRRVAGERHGHVVAGRVVGEHDVTRADRSEVQAAEVASRVEHERAGGRREASPTGQGDAGVVGVAHDVDRPVAADRLADRQPDAVEREVLARNRPPRVQVGGRGDQHARLVDPHAGAHGQVDHGRWCADVDVRGSRELRPRPPGGDGAVRRRGAVRQACGELADRQRGDRLPVAGHAEGDVERRHPGGASDGCRERAGGDVEARQRLPRRGERSAERRRELVLTGDRSRERDVDDGSGAARVQLTGGRDAEARCRRARRAMSGA